MSPQERKQASRIIRNARMPERELFDLIEELQHATHDEYAEYDWQSAKDHLVRIQDALPLLFDLVANIQRWVK